MIKKKIFLFFIFLFMNNCGFTPQFSNLNNSQIQINLENYSGNRDLNIKLNSHLNKYSNSNSSIVKNFTINYQSQIEKLTNSKDSSGNATEFQLVARVNFQIKFNQELQTVTLSEKFNYKNIDDAFELKNYEKIIINNLSDTIINKLVVVLSTKFK